MDVHVVRFTTGPIETNTYIVFNTQKKCLIIDPSMGCDAVLSYIKENALIPEGIFITHAHVDHFGGIEEITALFPDVSVYIGEQERTMLKNPELNLSSFIGMSFKYDGAVQSLDEGTVTLNNFNGQLFCIPGHSPGGCALLIGKYLFCGDILFAGSVGRTDFPQGNHDLLIKGIKEKLMDLPDDTRVCPGHHGRSTIGRERRLNMFLRNME